MIDVNRFDWIDDDMKQTFLRMQKAQDEEDRLLILELDAKYEKLKQKHAQIENLKYEESLIKGDIIRYISERLYTSRLNLFVYLQGNLLWETWKWFNYHNKKDEFSKDEDCDSYKKSFNYVTKTIQQAFFSNPNDFELKEVLDYNHSQSTEFRYIYKKNKKKDVIIEIPNFNCCDDNNFLDLMLGYRVCYHEYENVISTLARSWFVDELKQKIDDYINCDTIKQDECEVK